MAKINPYLNFNGNTEEAFCFYKSVFGGEFIFLQRMKETPEGDKLKPEEQELIMHIALPIGSNILMGSDIVESMGHKLRVGNNSFISVSLETEEEADRIFNQLSADGLVHMPLQKTFWDAYFGILTDKYGIQWMVDCEIPKK
ncbi:MAG: VOC family protein [Lentimicrobium sp.]|jgi:PhnB protein|nr:VOC family protein [Lentimicrobium sp.]MDD2527338.1 VOC family protein [Lentimicrobiaceae bacterium]MDD4597191.1 VOC family protein [Lentimicrobiaceae bacterium]MDY0025375.1 VOC family protein [Lentimicrobium sp.]HAH56902.1 VOC family protein [Bacteroidales bacterium]